MRPPETKGGGRREAAVGAARDDEMAPVARHWRFVRPPKTKRLVDVLVDTKAKRKGE